MASFSIKFKYERTSSDRKQNLKRKQTVINRLNEQKISYRFEMGLFVVPQIPNNIKQLINIVSLD